MSTTDSAASSNQSSTNCLSGQLGRRFVLAVLFAVTLLVCRWLAYQLRFDFHVPEQYRVQHALHWHWVTVLQLVCLLAAGQFSGIYRYFSLPDILRLAAAMFSSGSFLYVVRLVDIGYSPPLGVILLQSAFAFLALGAIRTGWRVACERYFSGGDRPHARHRAVAIIGAGDAGASLICDLHAHPHLGMDPVVLFDDDRAKWKSRLHGVPVLGAPEPGRLDQARKRYGFGEVIIAMPSASPRRLGEVVALLQQAGLKYVTVPGIDQLTSGTVSISQVRPVRIEDLLGRDPVELGVEEIRGILKGRTVMVTGAGGSIGSELCRQVASFQPARLLLLDQSEVQLFQIEQELIKLGHGGIIRPLIADILDKPRLSAILREHRPAAIFHAAAHKHVPMMEAQPSEAIKNNGLGTANLAELALEYEVERFLMISTDKAVNPTSVMGASKRLAEVFLQALAQRHPGSTRFVAVRFGNVLGSSGSVVPIFEKQIAQGGPVTVTHPDVVRYFMTIPEAVGLVLQSAAIGTGGEIFVLDMGKPVGIADLARHMIRLSGLEPDRDIQIKFVGLRPGEKLFEELKHLHANCTGTSHPRILRLTSEPARLEDVRRHLAKFNGNGNGNGTLHTATAGELKGMLKEIMPEYTPYIEPEQPPSDRRGTVKAAAVL